VCYTEWTEASQIMSTQVWGYMSRVAETMQKHYWVGHGHGQSKISLLWNGIPSWFYEILKAAESVILFSVLRGSIQPWNENLLGKKKKTKNSKPILQWHISSKKTTPPNPSILFKEFQPLVPKHADSWAFGITCIQTTILCRNNARSIPFFVTINDASMCPSPFG